jgi:hypothetical protein
LVAAVAVGQIMVAVAVVVDLEQHRDSVLLQQP